MAPSLYHSFALTPGGGGRRLLWSCGVAGQRLAGYIFLNMLMVPVEYSVGFVECVCVCEQYFVKEITTDLNS